MDQHQVGKSTVAKIIAKNLNYTYLDTGAMYRCATYLALQHGYEAQDVSKILGLLAEDRFLLVKQKMAARQSLLAQKKLL